MPDYRHIEPPPDEYAPVIPFDLFMSRVLHWKQDQHVGIIGPTDQGKTNLAYHLLSLRDYVDRFATICKNAIECAERQERNRA